jgi:hypothetical protein
VIWERTKDRRTNQETAQTVVKTVVWNAWMEWFQSLGHPQKALEAIIEQFGTDGAPHVQILNRLLT